MSDFNLASSSKFKTLELPKWYHQCLARLYADNQHDTQKITFYDYDRLKEEYSDAQQRTCKQMFIAQKYSGMGYYHLVGIMLTELNDEFDCKAFFTVMLGGSNELDRETNYSQFSTKPKSSFILSSLNDAVLDTISKDY